MYVCVLVAGAPNNLTVASVMSSSVTVTWEEPTEVNGILSGYRIQVLMGSEVISSDTVPGNTTRFEATSLQPFTEHTLEVAAINGVGLGDKAVTTVITSEAGEYGVWLVAFEYCILFLYKHIPLGISQAVMCQVKIRSILREMI